MKNTKTRLLVIRTSAMGDVALVTPVLTGLLKQYPDTEVVMVTRSAFNSFFNPSPKLSFFYPDFKDRHKGLRGILRLFKDINKEGEVSYIVDLHDVLRSKLLRFLFRLVGVKSAVIDKGRKEKKGIISGRNKRQLKHSVERYSETFSRAGFPVVPVKGPWIMPPVEHVSVNEMLADKTVELNIGVAPFAKHKLKMWPGENMTQLLHLISHNRKCKFFLFGGPEEVERLVELQKDIPEAVIVAGKLSLDEELDLISRLSFMIAMDSSNMHMAALTGVRVISIWGGTDPITGFAAWDQPAEYSIKVPIDELTCRPCTVFGKGECKRGDFACMLWLTPENVFKNINDLKLY